MLDARVGAAGASIHERPLGGRWLAAALAHLQEAIGEKPLLCVRDVSQDEFRKGDEKLSQPRVLFK